jgi:putative ATP-dependent endonuclease of OLD family
LTEDLLSEDRCGLYLRGYRPFNPINDDPEDGWEPVVTIRLRVSNDLEPHWEIIKDGVPDPKPLSWRDRERFCMARLGNDVDRHLTWSRGSALSRITEKSADPASMLALVNRAANDAILSSTRAELEQAAKRASAAAVRFGVSLPELLVGLDTRSQGFGTGALALHDTNRVPVRGCGLGSKRLTGLAIQHEGLGDNSILLIDEIEHGLEPHRIRRLIKRLCEDRSSKIISDGAEKPSDNSANAKGQVITTTHSPTPIMALEVSCLRFVRCKNGITEVVQIDASITATLQPIARKFSLAFLARKVIVCEGKTEEAILRILDDYWATTHQDSSFATCGVVPLYGEGRSNAPNVAVVFRNLGYDVSYFGDSDQPLSISEGDLTKRGITVAVWSDNMAIEERVSTDLPLSALQDIIAIATARYGDGQVRSTLKKCMGIDVPTNSLDIRVWIAGGLSEAFVRTAIGKAAKSKDGEWFKDISSGEELGRVIVAHLSSIPNTPLAKTLGILEGWVYAE